MIEWLWLLCGWFGHFVAGLWMVQVVCGEFEQCLGGLTCLWLVYGQFVADLWVVWLICGWFRVLQVRSHNMIFGRAILHNTACQQYEKYNTQTFDNNQAFGAPARYLSKTFDDLPHMLLIAKLNAYGFGLNALKLKSINKSINKSIKNKNQ